MSRVLRSSVSVETMNLYGEQAAQWSVALSAADYECVLWHGLKSGNKFPDGHWALL